jgi:soluble lytic murein transglycosylase-like protein
MGPKSALFFAALLWVAGAEGHPRIYMFIDADGIKHYTDVPDSNRYKLLMLSTDELTRSGDHYNAGTLAKATQYDAFIEKAGLAAAVEPNLLRAVIVVESGFNARAVSRRGAVGLMQLMPATASRFGVSNPFDPQQNIHAGARYLKFLMNRFGTVRRNGGQIPPFSETMAYVPKVMKIYRKLSDQPRAT